MIGNVFPFKDTGYSILEEGEIKDKTFELIVNRYLLADAQGNVIGDASNMAEAKLKLEKIIADLKNK